MDASSKILILAALGYIIAILLYCFAREKIWALGIALIIVAFEFYLFMSVIGD